MPIPNVFLVGVPKAGTTWLAYMMNQHSNVCLSNPKEPNIISSHKGTFARSNDAPKWSEFESCFEEGAEIKLDASIHTFSCPFSAQRIHEKIPDAKFILCLREPVARSVSHWNMVRNTREDVKNDSNWIDFEAAWSDERLRCDSFYGTSMKGWLKHFNLSQFLIIDSADLRRTPAKTIREIEVFLELSEFEYDFDPSRHSNSAESRRPITIIGRIIRGSFSAIPKSLKLPIVSWLQNRDINIYRLPMLSRRGISNELQNNHFRISGPELNTELIDFEEMTGFETKHWREEIQSRIF